MGTKAKIKRIRKIPPIVQEERERVKGKIPEGVLILQPKGSVA